MSELAHPRGWSYVIEPENEAPPESASPVLAGKQTVTRRPHGYGARIELLDRSDLGLPVAAWLRAASAVGQALEALGDGPDRPLRVVLGPAGTEPEVETGDDGETLHLDGAALAATASRHPVEAQVRALLEPGAGTRRVVPAAETDWGSGAHDLTWLDLDEGSWDEVTARIGALRDGGATTHIAVGGAMPRRVPEHVAAHLDGATFFCRGSRDRFEPRLARIAGGHSGPLSAAQRSALLAMDGLIAVDRAGRALVAANPGWVAVASPTAPEAGPLSLAELCLPADEGELPKLDPEWARALASRDRLELDIGSLCDPELERLELGHRVAHIRALLDALDARGVEVHTKIGLADGPTTALELVATLEEVGRLSLRHPDAFRPELSAHRVCRFPSAAYQARVRKDQSHGLVVREVARVPGYPELDYPFVAADPPVDHWVASAAEAGFLDAQGHPMRTLDRLQALWRERVSGLDEGAEREEGERLVRRVDDLPRRLVFELMEQARLGKLGEPDPVWPSAPGEDLAATQAVHVLGRSDTWKAPYRQFAHPGRPRLTALVADPELGGEKMSPRVLGQCLDLLLATRHHEVMFQMRLDAPPDNRWGEVLWEARRRAEAAGKELGVVWIGPPDVVSTVGVALDHLVIDAVPDTVGTLAERFLALADGSVHLAIQPQRAPGWTVAAKKALADQLFTIGNELRSRWDEGDSLGMLDIEALKSGQWRLTVRGDGRIEHGMQQVGHLDDLASFDRYVLDGRVPPDSPDGVLHSFLNWLLPPPP